MWYIYPHTWSPFDCRWHTDNVTFSNWKSVQEMQPIDCLTHPNAPSCPNRTKRPAGPVVCCHLAEWNANWPAAAARRVAAIWNSPSNKFPRGRGHTWAMPPVSRGIPDSSSVIFCRSYPLDLCLSMDGNTASNNNNNNTVDQRLAMTRANQLKPRTQRPN